MKNPIKQISILQILLFLLSSLFVHAQNKSVQVYFESIDISELGGIQSYSFGQYDGKWLILGGRLDGLHRRQPWASFDIAGHNNQLIVIDPINGQKWSYPLEGLPAAIKEQLSSTNMEFYQEGNTLYCLGGYGYSASSDDHITFPYLTAIDVPGVINAVINQDDPNPFFRQVQDQECQVTGGKLKKINNDYYLLGGQLFLGRYNPMGPDHGPGFTQEYTDAVKIFNIEDDGSTIKINHIHQFQNSIDLHRRDYNAEAQIFPDESEGITMFSGVFRTDIDLPWLNSVDVFKDNYRVNNDFEQLFNHYHCPVIPLYDAMENEMHTIFFGGIAQFYEENGEMIQDNNVPFVSTIARVTRDANGNMTEHKLDTEMPGLLGAGAEFIPLPSLPVYSNGVIKVMDLAGDTTLIGHIFGGINSSEPNIFFINNGTQSSASNVILKVFLVREDPSVSHDNPISVYYENPRIYPNPNHGDLKVKMVLSKNEEVTIILRDDLGRSFAKKTFENLPQGSHILDIAPFHKPDNGVVIVEILTDENRFTEKLILE